jgi:hypothetical protein
VEVRALALFGKAIRARFVSSKPIADSIPELMLVDISLNKSHGLALLKELKGL